MDQWHELQPGAGGRGSRRQHEKRSQDDDVYLIGNKGAESRNLILLLILRVVEFQINAELLRSFLERSGVGGTPAALGSGLDKADG